LKVAALAAHHSQLDEVDGWAERVRQRAREAGQPSGYAAAEVFRRMIV
jgi:LmbE family N-acetylglucosaminyl deacetylase